MNKGISTPFNCAQRKFSLQIVLFYNFFNNSCFFLDLSENHCTKYSLALIDSNIPWDMHRPIHDSCTLQLLNFTISDPHIVNRAFWRTCSFMLGSVLQDSFKDDAGLFLHSFPGPNVKSGSFVYDIGLQHSNWIPNLQELRTISAGMVKLAAKDLKIERLDVSHELAVEMFKDNPYKKDQLPSISNQSNGSVTVYRVGDHIDISRGPMVSSTKFLGKCTVSAVHKIGEDKSNTLYRVQGVALPVGFVLNHFAYGILEQEPVCQRFVSFKHFKSGIFVLQKINSLN